MILAGDIGGTKTLIGLFAAGARRPTPVAVRTFPTTAYPGLPAIIEEFRAAHPDLRDIDAAVFGVAGPIINQSAEMTNVDWRVDGAELVRVLGVRHVRLLNDLEAMAYGILVLEPDELSTLQTGHNREDGNLALIAAGTGLGEALLHRVADRYLPVASEGGHTDYAARTDRELELVTFLRDRYGRAEVEHVLSGPGLINLSDFTHQDGPCVALARQDDDGPDVPAEITKAALANECARCVEALDLFVAAYGAAAGNLALTAVTTGGVFIGGGIAPRILPALAHNNRFMQAFTDKGPMRPLLEAMPVHVILNPQSGLLGAAVYANRWVG
jgi:glucokinase